MLKCDHKNRAFSHIVDEVYGPVESNSQTFIETGAYAISIFWFDSVSRDSLTDMALHGLTARFQGFTVSQE